MVVAEEYVAFRVMEVIQWREDWLVRRGLPLDTILDEGHKTLFLKDAKEEYNATLGQVQRQIADEAIGGKNMSGGNTVLRKNTKGVILLIRRPNGKYTFPFSGTSEIKPDALQLGTKRFRMDPGI